MTDFTQQDAFLVFSQENDIEYNQANFEKFIAGEFNKKKPHKKPASKRPASKKPASKRHTSKKTPPKKSTPKKPK